MAIEKKGVDARRKDVACAQGPSSARGATFPGAPTGAAPRAGVQEHVSAKHRQNDPTENDDVMEDS